jgi:hypothetical protein
MTRFFRKESIMNKIVIALFGLFAAGLLEASCSLSSARLSSGLVKVGDTERRVIQAAPDRTLRLETHSGGAAGHRHDFYQSDTTVQIYIQGGRIQRICRIRDRG